MSSAFAASRSALLSGRIFTLSSPAASQAAYSGRMSSQSSSSSRGLRSSDFMFGPFATCSFPGCPKVSSTPAPP
eukprot:535285-Prymnesium_polylepis.1